MLPLLLKGDAWVAVGSSQDLIGISERMSSVSLSAPRSGVPLWADMWTVPRGAKGGSRGQGPSPLLPSWLEFGLSPARGIIHSGLKSGNPEDPVACYNPCCHGVNAYMNVY